MCGEDWCEPCFTAGKNIECRKRNLVYEMRCMTCETTPKNRKYVYVGKTNRSSKERVDEHIDDWDNQLEKSQLWKHQVNIHGISAELKPKFSYKIFQFFRLLLKDRFMKLSISKHFPRIQI